MYTTEQRGNVSIIRIKYRDKFEQRFLLTSDRHWDNPKSLQDLQLRHLDEAQKSAAGILDFGDLFCAMQGKYDKRANKASLRPEHQVSDYLDALVDTATPFFAPYANQIIRLCYGNHETSILERHETDLTRRLVDKLNQETGSRIHHGGYSGWVHFIFQGKNDQLTHKKLWYIHGYGGGGPVTKGVIQSNRQAVYTPDANFVVNGHIHEEWNLTITRTRLSDQSEQSHDEQQHIRIPTYKDEYGNGFSGWHVGRGGPAQADRCGLAHVPQAGRLRRRDLFPRKGQVMWYHSPRRRWPNPNGDDAAIGVFNTTAYLTADQAQTYFAGRLHSDAWDCASVTDQGKALLQATNAIDRLNFAGLRTADYNQRLAQIGEDGVLVASNILLPTSPYQTLEFPRNGDAVVPREILAACCEIALALLDGVDPEMELRNMNAVHQGFAAVRQTYDTHITNLAYRHGIPSVVAWNYLMPFLADPTEINTRRVS